MDTITTQWLIHLDISKRVASLLCEKMKKVNFDPFTQTEKAAAAAAEILYRVLPFGHYQLLRNFGQGKLKACSLVINGLPTSFSTLPATPASDDTINGKDYLSEYLCLGLGKIARMKAHRLPTEKDGRILQQVIPLEGFEHSESGIGSIIDFSLHVENSFEKMLTRFFCLFCLRGASNAFTTLYPFDDMVASLPPSIIESLLKPEFLHITGPSFSQKQEIIRPILEEKEGMFYGRLNTATNRTLGITEEAKMALEEARIFLSEEAEVKKICLEAGDMIFVNNRRCMHGRSGYTMHPDPALRRWLERCYFNL